MALAGFSIVVAGCASSARSEEVEIPSEKSHEIMNRIYSSMSVLLPLAVQNNGDALAREHDAAKMELENLRSGATHVLQHAEDPFDQFLARSLVDDFRRARRAFIENNYESAAFFIRESVDDCVSCHMEIVRPHEAPLAKGFAKRRPFQRLDTRERMRLALATYQIEDALSIAEAALDDASTPTHELDDIALDYLLAGVRVARSPRRVAEAIDRLVRRDGLNNGFRSDLQQWSEALDEVVRHSPLETLSSARRQLALAERVGPGRAGMRARVHAIIASRILSDWLASHGPSDERSAEACFEMGRAEQAIGRDYWPPKSDFFFECAIERAPGTELARRAYSALRDDVVQGYSGSSGTHIPIDDLRRLERLASIANSAVPATRESVSPAKRPPEASGPR